MSKSKETDSLLSEYHLKKNTYETILKIDNGAEDNIQFDSSSKTSKKKSSDFHNYESKKISMTYSWSNINVYHVLPDKNLWRPFIKRQLKNSNKKHLLRDEIREDLDKLVVGRTRLPPSRLIESASELEVPSTCENEQTDQLKEQEADAMREIMKNKMASVANLQVSRINYT
ncbi:hypothetical protein TKK_0001600 [Trichogramma kaykai]